ncbi:MAG: hypothetical protein V1875_02780 [Candidatus Altiarchaeota archaeon]
MPKRGEGGVGVILHHLVGEVCCVTKTIKARQAGLVRIWGKDFEATGETKIPRGRWVRVIAHSDENLEVVPLNVWLGSCCC